MTDTSSVHTSSGNRHPSGSACFRIGVAALIFHEGKVLLAHRRDIDWWNLPGGGMEEGETVDEALRREVLEETGLEVEVGQLVGVYSKPLKQEVVLAFRCHILNGNPHETEETRECRYFAPDALPPNMLPKHRQRVEDALLNQQSAIIRAQRSSTEEDQNLPGEN
ncbi:MAG TPA: NUDIX domain-containing protein [Ktedonobacteraceae bacterium]|nr:NUDIX domain-containing protein [Ktedonobacteraceae bacterium]